MTVMTKAQEIWSRHKKTIPGGVMSLNRKIDPMRIFVRAKGAYMWDIDGNKYIDYHAAFSPHLLGHNDPDVNAAVIRTLQEETSLMGAGTTLWEGDLAELFIACVPTMQKIQITNSGSEATYHAIRLARAITEREELILIQGGYNGWHNDVAFNLMDQFHILSKYQKGDELPPIPISAGIPGFQQQLVHVVQFNDLDAMEIILKKRQIACVITEPILQNIGVVKPNSGYLEGLRHLCTLYGSLLIFDEVKTGFRTALGGYQSLCQITPDLSSFGKGVANGYPLGIIAGKGEYMDYFDHSDPHKRVMIAGTYNGHPVPVAAAIATLNKLKNREAEIYAHLDALGSRMQHRLQDIFSRAKLSATVVRQGSAFVVYFMEKAPEDWLEISRDNDMNRDALYRRLLAEKGIFHFPTPTKQGSISFAHTEEDIDVTLQVTDEVVRHLRA